MGDGDGALYPWADPSQAPKLRLGDLNARTCIIHTFSKMIPDRQRLGLVWHAALELVIGEMTAYGGGPRCSCLFQIGALPRNCNARYQSIAADTRAAIHGINGERYPLSDVRIQYPMTFGAARMAMEGWRSCQSNCTGTDIRRDFTPRFDFLFG